MKKLLITLSLLIITNSAYAEWVALGKIENTEYYYDKSSITRVGNVGRIWRYNNNTEENIRYKSVLALNEYDCINKTQKIVSFTEYSEYDLKGKETKITKNLLPTTEDFIQPNSIDYFLIKMVCKK